MVVAGVFMAGLDVFIVNIAFPQLHTDFPGTSLRSLSWVLNSYTIVFAAFLIAAGRWSDTFGRKRSYLLGTGLFVTASAACALAPSIPFLVAARAVQGLGAALLMPASLGLLLPEFPPEQRHIPIGIWAAVGGIAAAAGPPLGGLLVQISWRWVFIVNVPVGLASLIAGWRILREVRHPDASRPDFLGAGLLTAAMATLVVAIIQGSTWGWASPRILGLFALTALLIALVGRRIATHPSPIVEPALLKVRTFSLATTASLLFFMAFAAMLLASVLFLTGIWHEPILTAGLQIFPGPAMAAAIAVPGARLGARFGPGRVGAVGALLFALGGVWWVTHLTGAPHYARRLPAGHDDRRGRRRPDDPLADRRRRLDARPRAAGDRHRGADHGPADRLGAGLRDPRRGAGHAAHRGRFQGRLGAHDRREPARRGDARRDRRARAGVGNRPNQPERSAAGEAPT